MSQAGPASLGPLRLTLENVAARDGSPFTWGDLVSEWQSYLQEKNSQQLVFIGDGAENADQIMTVPYSHRFQKQYTRMQYAKIQSFIRGALSDYEDPHLAILTFSTSTLQSEDPRPPALRDDNSEPPYPRPPLDHMDELLRTWEDGVYYELNQVMNAGRRADTWPARDDWEYLYILEPTTDRGRVGGGYAHAHVGIVVDGEVESGRFESVISRHLIEAPNATGDAHELEDAVVVKPASALNNPGAYLFKYLGKSWDVEDMADYEKRFAALLFDQGRQRFRASNGAQRWMGTEEEGAAEPWLFAGVASSEQARALASFEDAAEFRVATEGGVRSWLQRKQLELESGEVFRPVDPDAVGSWEQPPADRYPPPVNDLPTSPSVAARSGAGDRPPPGA